MINCIKLTYRCRE